ncbi:hypothetical protein ASD21_04290 [Caulobacter sp. Root1455]|nr:hypothetical protein ASD38_10140 [Caulobacter sp. Root487D2Y]KQY95740.1 hypothetical protein ASD21_04290 [Caulobacter sp. Root1455]
MSYAFFLSAIVYGICGMVLGMVMGISQDHTLMPVHAHVNLLGWVSLAIMGGFYALAGDRRPPRLAWVNFALSNIGILLVGPLLAVLLVKGDMRVVPFMALGEVMLVTGMVVFGIAVLRTARTGPQATSGSVAA